MEEGSRFSKSGGRLANDGRLVISTLLQGRSPCRDEGDRTVLMHRQVLITGCVVFPGSSQEFYEGCNAYRFVVLPSTLTRRGEFPGTVT